MSKIRYGSVVEVLDAAGQTTGFRGRVVGRRMAPLGMLIEIAGAGRRMELTADRIVVVHDHPVRNLPMISLRESL